MKKNNTNYVESANKAISLSKIGRYKEAISSMESALSTDVTEQERANLNESLASIYNSAGVKEDNE